MVLMASSLIGFGGRCVVAMVAMVAMVGSMHSLAAGILTSLVGRVFPVARLCRDQ